MSAFSRRFVLRGAGAALSLPVLGSLLTPSEARAQAATPRLNFVQYATPHGGVWQDQMFPTEPVVLDAIQTSTYAGRAVRAWRLAAGVTNGVASLSPVLSAPATRLTAGLTSKMLVLRGLDIPFSIGHHTGGHLGNFARNDANSSDGALAQVEAQRRTVDQILAWSPSFYGSLDGVKERALVLGSRLSYADANPLARSGGIQEVGVTAQTPLQLFDTLFPQDSVGSSRPLIIDRVLGNYHRLQANPRLSSADKARLEDHIERVTELQRKLSTSNACAVPQRPSANLYSRQQMADIAGTAPYANDPAAHAAFFQAFNDGIALAFSCGLSRVAVLRVDPDFSPYVGNWHEDVAHQALDPDGVKQALMAAAQQRFFSNVFVDLAAKLDAIDSGGGATVLDHSLMVWSQEHGSHTHEAQSMPVVTFGGAAGFLKTGQTVDYRDTTKLFSLSEPQPRSPGLLWHQWLGTVLQAMRIPRSEWENTASNPGYPDWKFANVSFEPLQTADAYPEAVWSAAGDILPYLRSG